jgi:hypothetical protein
MSFAQFKGVSQIGYASITDQLNDNLVSMLDYGLLSIGGFISIHNNQPFIYGGSQSILRLCDDNRFIKGKVWEGARSNWVWEKNIEYSQQPISISGIYVNNVFIPNNSGYYIDYPRGRVVFDNAISPLSVVSLEYSYRYYNTYNSSMQWFRQLMNNTFNVASPDYHQYGSGLWSLMSDSRAQLPAIFPYVVDRRKWIPKQLGGGTYCVQDILFYCFAESAADRDKILDILSMQKEKRIFFYDKNLMSAATGYPLNFNGKLVNTQYKNFVDLTNTFLWADALITEASVDYKNDEDAPNLYRGTSKWTLSIDLPNV